MYKIADYHGEELEGTFYEQELLNIIKKDSDFYRIEKVIKSRIRGKRREYLVKIFQTVIINRFLILFENWTVA